MVQKNSDNGPKTGRRVLHAGVMLLFMLGVQLLGTVLLSLIKVGRDPELESAINTALSKGDHGPFNELLSSCTLMGTLIGGLIALLPYIIRDIARKNYCVAWINPWAIPALISAGVVLNVIASEVISMLPDQGAEATAELIAYSETEPLIAILSVGIITPIVEEMYFRRAIINSIRDRNIPIAIILSAVVFAMLHTGTVQMGYAFAFGILFGTIYARTGNLLYSAILHMSVNTSSTLMVLGGDEAEKYAVPVITICAMITLAAGLVIFVKKRRKA